MHPELTVAFTVAGITLSAVLCVIGWVSKCNDRTQTKLEDKTSELHSRISDTQKESRKEFTPLPEFRDFRNETRISFKSMEQKIDKIPEKMVRLLNGREK